MSSSETGYQMSDYGLTTSYGYRSLTSIEGRYEETIPTMDAQVIFSDEFKRSISVKEKQGTRYHISMTLKPNCNYALRIRGTAFEVNDGVRRWCDYIPTNSEGKPVSTTAPNGKTIYSIPLRWQQDKWFFFRTVAEHDIPEQIDDLQPYVAAAYPASDDGKLFNSEADSAYAYYADLARPMIILNKDISTTSFKKGKLYWQNTCTNLTTNVVRTYKTDNVFTATSNGSLKGVNMKAKDFIAHTNVFNGWKHHLQLLYETKVIVDCTDRSKFSHDKAYYQTQYGLLQNYLSEKGRWQTGDLQSEVNRIMDKYTYHNAYGQTFYDTEAYKNAYFYLMTVINGDGDLVAGFDAYAQKNQYVNGECTKDTTIVLADLHFLPSPHEGPFLTTLDSEKEPRTVTKLLPYEEPFVGMRITGHPQYSYTNEYTNMGWSDNFGAYHNRNQQSWWKKEDPYLYFAYLSNAVFIGGYRIYPYAFDEVGVSHASETLTFSYNGTDVQGMKSIVGVNDNVMAVRDKMYGTWNDWHYNDSSQPYYPLPSGTGELYERTVLNQDGKTPLWVPTSEGYTSTDNDISPKAAAMRELIKDFAAPYYMADELSYKLKSKADELLRIYQDHMTKRADALKNNLNSVAKTAITNRGYDINTPNGRLAAALDDGVYKILKNYGKQQHLLFPDAEGGDAGSLNLDIRKWNDKYRGRYMTVESRGFKVKVPYYQLPLLFGDCFGYYSGDDQPNGMAVDSINGWWLKGLDRAFDTSLRLGVVSRLGDRWGSQVSNLMFFSLTNTAPLEGIPFKHSTNNRYAQYRSHWKGDQYIGQRYISERGPLSTNMLNELESMPVGVYRVNAYDFNSGQYFYDPNVESKGDGMKAFNYNPLKASDNKAKYPLLWLNNKLVGRPTVICDGDDKDADNAEDINKGEDVEE